MKNSPDVRRYLFDANKWPFFTERQLSQDLHAHFTSGIPSNTNKVWYEFFEKRYTMLMNSDFQKKGYEDYAVKIIETVDPLKNTGDAAFIMNEMIDAGVPLTMYMTMYKCQSYFDEYSFQEECYSTLYDKIFNYLEKFSVPLIKTGFDREYKEKYMQVLFYILNPLDADYIAAISKLKIAWDSDNDYFLNMTLKNKDFTDLIDNFTNGIDDSVFKILTQFKISINDLFFFLNYHNKTDILNRSVDIIQAYLNWIDEFKKTIPTGRDFFIDINSLPILDDLHIKEILRCYKLLNGSVSLKAKMNCTFLRITNLLFVTCCCIENGVTDVNAVKKTLQTMQEYQIPYTCYFQLKEAFTTININEFQIITYLMKNATVSQQSYLSNLHCHFTILYKNLINHLSKNQTLDFIHVSNNQKLWMGHVFHIAFMNDSVDRFERDIRNDFWFEQVKVAFGSFFSEF